MLYIFSPQQKLMCALDLKVLCVIITWNYLNIRGEIWRPFLRPQPAITCSKLTIETLEQGVKYVQICRSGVIIANFEHISHLVLLFLLLTLSR